ncbi:hypothetical protein L3Y34_014949 [Caenorhabditis briggsae]|uniref:Uncharacterized protein n=2 Tax=Caenorhabditis briggsae TaxID=6238 RepID=A0AAE9DS95_CAEBR|nr:hypothetical protein L3Y34_014949 [Caenorhabditis briggsae]
MSSVMRAMLRLSKALDSKLIGEVALALQDLDDSGKCSDAFEYILYEIISWDLTQLPAVSEGVIRRLMDLVNNRDSLENISQKILKAQSAVAVQLAVTKMIEENWLLSHEACNDVWRKIKANQPTEEKLDENMIDEYVARVTANCKILRLSGTPRRFLSSMLLECFKASSQFRKTVSTDFLNELAILSSFHPVIIAGSMKKGPNIFLLPQVFTEYHRFCLETQEFISFYRHHSVYHRANSCGMLSVFRSICDRMNRIEPLQGEDIENVVDLWLAAIPIFDGHGISMNDITDSAKLIEASTSKFDIKRRPLFLKRFLRKLSEKKDASVGMEPQIVATIITTFQRNAFNHKSSEFYEELGEFWTLCLKMKYDDIYYATVFYSAVFTLAQAQAVFRVKKELCRAVYEKILQPMHQQIVDFVKLKNLETNKASTDEERIMLEQKNLGASYFSILTCTYKNAEDRILEFINQ